MAKPESWAQLVGVATRGQTILTSTAAAFLPTLLPVGRVAGGEEVIPVKGYVVRKGSRFYAVIYEGVDPLTGRERRRCHPAGESRGEAELLATRLAGTASAVVRQPGPTLAMYLLRQWLPAKEMNLRPSTWDGYRRLIELHVVPRLGTVSLRRLRAEQLETLYAELLATGRRDGRGGLDPKTVLEVHILLRKALADARRRGLVVHNVAEDAEAPKRRRPNAPLRAWNVEQLKAFLAVARSKRLFPAYWLAATTGMRSSELLGLRWGDIDLGAGRLSISRALVSVGYVLHDSPGKTRMSRRAVDLDALTIEVLSARHAGRRRTGLRRTHHFYRLQPGRRVGRRPIRAVRSTSEKAV